MKDRIERPEPGFQKTLFLESLELFNAGRYFESHEVMEKLWIREKKDPYRSLYQGMIQAAAACLQWERGQIRGAYSLFQSALGKLKPYRPAALGVDIERFLKDLEVFFKACDASRGEPSIPFHAEKAPRILYRTESAGA